MKWTFFYLIYTYLVSLFYSKDRMPFVLVVNPWCCFWCQLRFVCSLGSATWKMTGQNEMNKINVSKINKKRKYEVDASYGRNKSFNSIERFHFSIWKTSVSKEEKKKTNKIFVFLYCNKCIQHLEKNLTLHYRNKSYLRNRKIVFF